jgi:hypothetical protein
MAMLSKHRFVMDFTNGLDNNMVWQCSMYIYYTIGVAAL